MSPSSDHFGISIEQPLLGGQVSTQSAPSPNTKTMLCLVQGGLLQGNGIEGSNGIGSCLGWAMATIYMGGRLPQLCLNVSFTF
ncbi:hypothetical protein Patl1_32352 [Pistacia atlantica]|uniref:Uncharacterized protein n=1 Tax=Pistacia atlantica TaxID=434234 RepID=A0ACC1AQA0_9ROSI|nr:hypothetical protein Patl1_32352 [Pistacia atlantica]